MYQRRRFLRAGVAAAGLAVAGCTSQDDSADPDGDDDGTDDAVGTETPDGDTETDDQTETTTDDDGQVTDRVEVISEVGFVADGTVSAVELMIAPAPGAGPIDLSRTTIQWVDETGSYDLAAASSELSADGTFRITAIKDDDDSAPVLNDPSDRLQLSMDLGTADEVSGVEAFGQPLETGASATLQLTTESGATTTARLTVPEVLSGEERVVL